MPVNSFDDYYLSWKPERKNLTSPLYLSLSGQLEHDIKSGLLQAGTKMPPQRELADYLDVSLNTITRVYSLCEKKGLLYAITGRGTFVSEVPTVNRSVVNERNNAESFYSLDIAAPLCEDAADLRHFISDIMVECSIENLFQYTYPLGTAFQRDAAVQWLHRFGISSNKDQILISEGTQNALHMVLTGLFKAGDRIAVDTYTYSNFIGLANLLGIVLVPIAGDKNGMISSELEKTAKTIKLNGIYLSPCCSNPQAICMPMQRREELAHIIRKENITVLEDDSYAFLLEEPLTPLSVLVPDNSVYFSGLNKALFPGLRTTYLWHSPVFREKMEQACYYTNLIVNPVGAQIAAKAVFSNIADQTLSCRRNTVRRRSAVYGKFFPMENPYSYYQWLQLPDSCNDTYMESLLLSEGIRVYSSKHFLVNESDGHNYFRIACCAVQSDLELEEALSKVKDTMLSVSDKKPQLYTL